MTERVEAVKRDRMELRMAEGEGFEVVHLTAAARPVEGLRDAAYGLFRGAARACAEGGILPVREKIYGLLEARDEVLALRAEAYAEGGLDPEAPCTYVEGTPLEREELAGLQLFGIKAAPGAPPPRVITLPEGRLWEGRGFRVLYAPGITGLPEGGDPAGTETEQAECMFRRARAVISKYGFTFRRVARTWIHLKDILPWYGAFNVVRNAFFRGEGIGTDPERSFPASTGIQGTLAGEACSMELLAADGPGVTFQPVHASTRQGRSFDYGSAFSRAMRVKAGGIETIFVSGTASIDGTGATKHEGDAEAQVIETLLCVAALLEPLGTGLGGIHQATLFCKDREVYNTYRRTVRLLGIPAFPVIAVRADICRPDLLVEMEATAVVSRPAALHPEHTNRERAT